MNFQNPFHSVQSMVCTCLELVAKINMPCHAEGQKDAGRAARRGQPQGSAAGTPAQPPVPVGGGFALSSAAARCLPRGVPAHSPAKCERGRDRPRPYGARPCPRHLQVETLSTVTVRPCRPRGLVAFVPGCPGCTACPPATSAVST